MAKQPKYSIIIPVGMKPRPKIHEETAADILANHFKSDVYFIETGSHGTPDISAAARTISEKICVKPASSR